MLQIVDTTNNINVVDKINIDNKEFDLKENLSKYHNLLLITNKINVRIINGIVKNSNTAPKKVLKTMLLYEL